MNKVALSILISIILTIIIVSLANVGTSLFLTEPEYNDYCSPVEKTRAIDGEVTPQEIDDGCWEEYDAAREPYNQKRFYVFAGLGFLLLIVGLFVKEMLLQITSLASGGILVFEGIVSNLESKLIVFLSLLAILVIFGILAYRIIKKK